jgi:hypothetical protein
LTADDSYSLSANTTPSARSAGSFGRDFGFSSGLVKPVTYGIGLSRNVFIDVYVELDGFVGDHEVLLFVQGATLFDDFTERSTKRQIYKEIFFG